MIVDIHMQNLRVFPKTIRFQKIALHRCITICRVIGYIGIIQCVVHIQDRVLDDGFPLLFVGNDKHIVAGACGPDHDIDCIRLGIQYQLGIIGVGSKGRVQVFPGVLQCLKIAAGQLI